ncbi:class I SAM-dependent methyltransferase [Aspergillus homomorphus CBS 101889]|uniref:Methyltransferase domain-containing protein n=1 Tax=Aspergillus homomorphus (strain CBS 101889) TaxID=1450537 RepID=A0A395HLN6_ASPHC|nr:hypothetical protein BO97DRAFT_397413 [Aspergillus homomorphus CBS 101889]RAL08852.1 hypothetical protein BO97DRAFT_397413 [Aspergillus homomorphus CBS 101889]
MDPSVWYRSDFGPRLTPASQFVFNRWSGIADTDLPAHLHRIRDRAWPVGKYPCIGQWMFLLPGLAAFPEFPSILHLVRQPQATVLDLACGLGQDLRLLAAHADGAPTERWWAIDLEPRLWELGYELFRDRDRMAAQFVAGDFRTMAATAGSPLGPLCGCVDVVIANQFIHLFDRADQREVIKRIIALSKPGTMVVGFQQGRRQPREDARPWGTMFFHNRDSFVALWESIQRETATEWTMHVREVDLLQNWGLQKEDVAWMPADQRGLEFVFVRSN